MSRPSPSQADDLPLPVLVLAGLDPTGGAGLAADLRALAQHGAHALPVPTAWTAQSGDGVGLVSPLEAEAVSAMLEMVTRDLAPRAVKVGMLGSAAVGHVLLSWLDHWPESLPLVLDPVFNASDGAPLVDPPGVRLIREQLLPRARLVCPNLAEAGLLLGSAPPDHVGAAAAVARELVARGARAAVVTGGHLDGEPVDVLFDGEEISSFRRARLAEAHGTGCHFSAACAALLARGASAKQAVSVAGDYVARLLAGRRLAGGRVLCGLD